MKLGATADAAAAWIFPAGTTIPANGYLAVWCDGGQAASVVTGANLNTGFALGDASGALYLFNAAGQLVNSVEYGFQIPDRSFGLSAGAMKLLATPTRAATNSAAQTLGAVTQLRINEWMAQPGSGGDWFELYNLDANPVAMAGLYLTDDPSELGRSKFQIPALSFIAGQGWVKWEADSTPSAGRNHLNFTLDGGAEYLRLSNNDASITSIDTVSFGRKPPTFPRAASPTARVTSSACPAHPHPARKTSCSPRPPLPSSRSARPSRRAQTSPSPWPRTVPPR